MPHSFPGNTILGNLNVEDNTAVQLHILDNSVGKNLRVLGMIKLGNPGIDGHRWDRR